MRPSKKDLKESHEFLTKLLRPGDCVYTKLIHRSRSGMYRVIDLYVMRDNAPLRITWDAANLLEGYDTRHEGARASGCGMDMGYHLVHNLGLSLFPNGYTCLGNTREAGGIRCPSNDHTNGDRDYTPHLHKCGGYALTHRWL